MVWLEIRNMFGFRISLPNIAISLQKSPTFWKKNNHSPKNMSSKYLPEVLQHELRCVSPASQCCSSQLCCPPWVKLLSQGCCPTPHSPPASNSKAQVNTSLFLSFLNFRRALCIPLTGSKASLQEPPAHHQHS